MSEDRKSDHYTSAECYRDLDGNYKQFTFVDHDKKPTISTHSLSTDEKEDLNKIVKEDIKRCIDEILSLPAVSFLSSGNSFAEDYIERDPDYPLIKWREEMVREALSINHTLRYNIRTLVWKCTVKPQYWNEDMSHEDILAGCWKKWT